MRRILVVLVLAVLAVFLTTEIVANRSSLQEERLLNDQLSTLQQGQLDLFQQRVSALLTMCTVIIGGAGALLIHFREQRAQNTTLKQFFAIAAVVFASLSMYGGYVAFDAANWMLASRFFNLEATPIELFSKFQLWTALFAALCVATSLLLGVNK